MSSILTSTRWYREGTATVSKGDNEVSGAGTLWLKAGINPGDIFTVNGSRWYEVRAVASDGLLTLMEDYEGDSVSGADYAVIRNFTANSSAKVSAQAAELFLMFAKHLDMEMREIKGKSAYEVAQDSGYSGTEKQWLESLTAYGLAKSKGYKGSLDQWLEDLKAAEEWTALKAEVEENKSTAANETKAVAERTSALEKVSFWLKPAPVTSMQEWRKIYREDDLGSEVTEEQFNEIYNWELKTVFVGSSWTSRQTFPVPPGLPEQDFWNEGVTVNGDGTWTADIRWIIEDALSWNSEKFLLVSPEMPLWRNTMTTYDERPSTGWTSGGYAMSRYNTVDFWYAWNVFVRFFWKNVNTRNSPNTPAQTFDEMISNIIYPYFHFGLTYGNFEEGKGFTSERFNWSPKFSWFDKERRFGSVTTREAVLPDMYNIFSYMESFLPSCRMMTGAGYPGCGHLITEHPSSLLHPPFPSQAAKFPTKNFQKNHEKDNGNGWSCWLMDPVSADRYAIYINVVRGSKLDTLEADKQCGIKPVFVLAYKDVYKTAGYGGYSDA